MKKIFIIFIAILLDLTIYLFLGIALMDYDDFYEESQGAYFSLSSMTNQQKAIWISFNVWMGLNLLVLAFLAYRLINKVREIIAK